MSQRNRQAQHGTQRVRVPEVFMPAMPPLDLFAAVDRWLRALLRRRRLRRQMRYDAHLLDDIGHDRASLGNALDRSGALQAGAEAAGLSRRAAR